DAGARRGEAFSATLLGEVLLMTGDAAAARAHLLEGAALSRQVGAVAGEALARLRLGEALLDLGDRDAAGEQLDEALALAHVSMLADHLLFLVHAAMVGAPEDPAEALAVVQRAEALVGEEPRCRFCPVDYYVAAATACAGAGDLAGAQAFLGRVEDV